MTNVWYQNPKVLLDNLNEFIPNKKLSKTENINSIARFTIYFSILIIIFQLNLRWLLISICLLLLSYYLDTDTDNKLINNVVDIINNNINFKNINKSTFDNPFMNYITNNGNNNKSNLFSKLLPKDITIKSDLPTTLNKFVNNNIEKFENLPDMSNLNSKNFNNIQLDLPDKYVKQDYITNNNTINYDLCITSNNNKSCTPNNKINDDINNLSNKFKIDNNLKKEIRKNYRSHLKFDSIDMWGNFINDRNFYTLPNTDLVNDQSGFAEWCYSNNGGIGKCKTDGSNCVKDRDIRYHKGRISSNNEE